MAHAERVSGQQAKQTVWRAFAARNYRLYFIGQGISLIGTWMQSVAVSWLVYRLTNSPFLLGLTAFISQIPMMLLMPITGVLADRWNRYRMMIIVQVVALVQAFILFLLYSSGHLSIWHLIALGFGLGLINTFDAPNRHAFVVQLVDNRRDLLPNAIALNSAMFNSARLIGPALAGVLIAALGEGLCFLLNALSFVAVLSSLLAMRIAPPATKEKKINAIAHELREGFLYTFKSRTFRVILLHYAWVSFAGLSVMVLMPMWARDILHGDSHTLGFLMGAAGIGAIIGAIWLAGRKHTLGLWRLIGSSSLIFGGAIMCLSFVRLTALAIALMVLAGLGMTMQMTTSNTFLQTAITDDKRSRVMAFYLLCFFATVPLGNLVWGAVAHMIGAPRSVFMAGLASACGSLAFFRLFPRPKAHD